MKFWNAAPLLRILLPFVAGVLTVLLTPYSTINLTSIILLLTVFLFLMTFFSVLSSYGKSWYYGVVLNILVFSIGYEFAQLKTDNHSPKHFSNYIKNATYVNARIDVAIVEKDKSVKAIVQLFSLVMPNETPVSGKALVYFQKEERSLKLNYGDELILKNEFKELPSAKNPGAFDYKKFMAHKNINQQAFLKNNQWVYTGKNSGNIFIAHSIRARNKLLAIFKQAQLKGDELAVASALLIGYMDKLDPDLLSAYSQTGALHVLSVSGLHVGIVFVVLNALLFFLDRFKYGVSLKAFLLIFFLWFYAFISGLSPSVMRAATMLSFIVYAKSFKKKSTIYNTLAASALFLLLCDPYYIVDVGFQLSYLAVIGIVCIQPFFSSFIESDNLILHQFMSLITVSIAAQLATFPISIYYFHQFPNYFLLTNLVAIPLSTCIIYLGIALILFSGNTFLFSYLSMAFSATVQLLNNCIKWISQLSYAITNGIFINIAQLFGMYLSIIFLLLFFYKKRVGYLKLFLWSLIALFIVQFVNEIQLQNQRKLTIYSVQKASVIDFIYKKEHVLLVDSGEEQIADQERNELQQYWTSLKLAAPIITQTFLKTPAVYIQDGTIQFYDKRIVVLKNEEQTKRLYKTHNSFKVEYVILSHNAKLSIEEIIAVYHPNLIVFDSSNKFYQLKKWRNTCVLKHQNYYSIIDSGAFVLEF